MSGDELKLAESILLVELRRFRKFQIPRRSPDTFRPGLGFKVSLPRALGRPAGHVRRGVCAIVDVSGTWVVVESVDQILNHSVGALTHSAGILNH